MSGRVCLCGDRKFQKWISNSVWTILSLSFGHFVDWKPFISFIHFSDSNGWYIYLSISIYVQFDICLRYPPRGFFSLSFCLCIALAFDWITVLLVLVAETIIYVGFFPMYTYDIYAQYRNFILGIGCYSGSPYVYVCACVPVHVLVCECVRAFVYYPLNKEKTNAIHVVPYTRRIPERMER